MNATIHLDLCAIFTPPHLKAYVPPQSDMIGHSLDKFDREVKKKKNFQPFKSLSVSAFTSDQFSQRYFSIISASSHGHFVSISILK